MSSAPPPPSSGPRPDAGAILAQLGELVGRARAALPGVHVEDAEFAAYVGERLPGGQPLAEAIAALHVEELYLACACARGDGAALRLFEERYLRALPDLLRRIERSPAALDEVCQALREKLLVDGGGERARILDYSGRGTLLGWLRVAAVRTALNQKRSVARRELDPEDFSAGDVPADPELDFLKRRYRTEFASAFQEALAALPPKARNILRLHFLDGLNIDRIGAVYQVHRATVARWIAGYCSEVQEAARSHLARVLRASPAELDSLARLVGSQLELSIRRALADEPPGDTR